MTFESEIQRLRHRVIPLEAFVQGFAKQFEVPSLFTSTDERGYRFTDPDYRHFCLLRACRIVSALNASIELALSGHTQEIGVLLRTVIEYSSQVEFVLFNRNEHGEVTGKAATFVLSFFSDNRRTGQHADGKRMKLNQKDVHDAVGAKLDEFVPNKNSKTTSDLMSHVYVVFSNYVHGRYPETMDLYGGRPGRFHLNGMKGTPKDMENIEVIDTLITTASNCLVQIAQNLQLRSLLASDPVLSTWYREALELGAD